MNSEEIPPSRRERLSLGSPNARRILDVISEGVAICDHRGRILWTNREFRRMHEYRDQELEDVNIIQLQVFHDDRPEYKNAVQSVTRRGTITMEEAWHRKWSGEVFPVLFNGRYDPGSGKREGRIFFSFWDITERKQAEELVQDYETKISLFNRLNRIFLFSRDEVPYEKILYQLCSYFRCEGAAFLQKVEKKTISLRAVQTQKKTSTLKGRLRSINLAGRSGLLVRRWEKEVTGYVNHPRQLSDCEKKLGIRNLLTLSLREGEPNGMIVLFNRVPEFRRQDVRDIKIISNQLVSLIKMMYRKARLKDRRERARIKLKREIKNREILIREIHHRVKNNLNMIYSLLHFQKKHGFHKDLKEVVSDIQNRIRSISLIHQHLYTSGNLARVSPAGYIRSLLKEIAGFFGLENRGISVHTSVSSRFRFNLSTMHGLGLIIHELVTNAVRHAFNEKPENGQIQVRLRKIRRDRYTLEVEDNGKGMSPGLYNDSANASMGGFLVKSLAQNLQGKIRVDSKDGTRITLEFSPVKD